MGNSAIAGFGLSSVQAISKYNDEKRQADVNNRVKAINNQKVTDNLISTVQSLEVKKDQIDEAAVARSIDAQRAEAMSSGAALATSGASGRGGTGSSMQQQDIDVNSNINEARSQMMKDRQLMGIRSEKVRAESKASSQFNRMPDQKVSKFSAVLDAGVSGFRNTVAFDQFGDAWDANFGESERWVPEVKPESLVDSFNTDSLIRTA